MKKNFLSVVFILSSLVCLSQEKELKITETRPKSLITDSTLVYIDSLKVSGNDHLRDNVIFAESRLSVGDTIRVDHLREQLIRSRANLLNTKLFNEVELLIYKWKDDHSISVEFAVDERWYIYPIPIVQLNGITFREWTDEFENDLKRLTYGLDLKHNNLTKRGDPLGLNISTGFEKNYEFDYFFPSLDKERNWGLGVSALSNQEKGAVISAVNNDYNSVLYDEVVRKSRAASVWLTKRKTINNKRSIAFGYTDLTISDLIKDSVQNYFAENANELSYFTMSFNMFLENRDLKEYPLLGSFFDATLGYQGFSKQDYENIFFEGRYNIYRPISDKLNISSSLLAGFNARYQPSFYNLSTFRLSGDERVRGFNDYQVFPASFVTSKTELKYRIMDRMLYHVPILPDRFEPVPMKIYPKLQFDAGKYFAADYDQLNPLNDDFLISGGAGLDVVTIYNTVLRMELTYNSLSETRFNFGVGKPF